MSAKLGKVEIALPIRSSNIKKIEVILVNPPNHYLSGF